MRIMASVWFSVVVILSVQKAFGDVCLKKEEDFSCDECIRCGGNWCNELRTPHCFFSIEDSWCPNDFEELPVVQKVNKPGVAVNPVYAERTLYIRKPNKLDIQYTLSKNKQNANMMIVHSTQSYNIELKEYGPKCSDTKCTTTIEAMASTEFCNATSGLSEYVEVKINVGLDEEVLVKYYVSCACECSQKVEKNSAKCNWSGDLSCGVCTCHDEWAGEYCDILIKTERPDTPICDEKRGDVVECSINPPNDADCSGNGYCGPCETCICYTDREGSQYFDQENNCADLCSVSSECEDCLHNGTAGECDNCVHSMTIRTYNQSLTEELEEMERKVWVSCNETILGCRIDYVAMRDERREIYVMIVRSCNDVDAAAVVGGQKVPIILGVLAIVAVVAAAGGIMLWKHMNTVPPVPLNDPQYQNIDAEDCTGENPLYKPPTSSFKNPTYGKW